MILRIIAIIIAITIHLNAVGQTMQKGVVEEYNGKAKKTPLPGVELKVRSAGSTVSDNNGGFILSFLTLKPGEKINVRRIEKLGYEVFNKEAIEQWNLNPKNPFVIIMCRSDRFKKIRDNYERVSSESYARQLKKEEAIISKFKADGKIKEAEYRKQLLELRESYEKQLDNLDNYIDKFSRIDLSELSQIELEIIELVQHGDFEEAIRRYEEQDYIKKYRKEIANLKEESTAIDQLNDVKQSKMQSRDSLLVAINRQVETLKLAGGKENYQKIAVILRDVAYCDTSNYYHMYNYGSFMETQNAHMEAIRALKTSYNNCTDNDNRIKVLIALSESYISISDFKSSEELVKDALAEADKFDNNELAWLYYLLGLVKYKQTFFDEAEALFLKVVEMCQNTGGDVEGQTYYALSTLYRASNKFEDALIYGQKCLNYFEAVHSEVNSNKYHEKILSCLSNVASIHFYSGNYRNAEKCFEPIISKYEELYSKNPHKYARDYAWNIVMYSKVLSKQENYEKAIRHLGRALQIFDVLYTEYPTAYGKDYVQALEECGICIIRINSVNKSESYFDKASSIARKLYELDDIAFRPLYMMNQYRNAFRYYSNNDYVKALEYFSRALSLVEPLYLDDDRTYGEVYTSILEFVGIVNNKMENYDAALDYLQRCLEIKKRMSHENMTIPKSGLAQTYWQLGKVYSNKKQWDMAIKYYSAAYQLYNSIALDAPQYNKYAVTMQRNLAAIYSDVFSDFVKAHNAIDIALTLTPKNISILEQKGELYIRQNNLSKATEVLNQILNIDSAYDIENSCFVKIKIHK